MTLPKLLVLLSPEGDAAARDVAEHCACIRDAYDITILGTRERRAMFEGFAYKNFRPSGIFGMGVAISTLRRAVTQLDPAIIHINGFAAASVALGTFPASIASRSIVSFHDPLREGELPKKLVERKFSGYLRRANAITATYAPLGESIAKRFGLHPEVVHVIPHGVDVPLETAPLVRPPGRSGPVLGWRGALAADRAWEVAVDALAKTRETFPDAHLQIAGDGRARQFVNAYVRTNGYANFVTFLGAIDAESFFKTIDLLLVPISRDAQPQAMLEGLVRGVPVVAANGGALANAVGAMETGWLVDDDATSFAAGVSDAWSRIDAAWAGAAKQSASARERYDRRAVTDAYLERYRSIVAKT
jgi:glycosyltransferase involved in cell wall biosynthesis